MAYPQHRPDLISAQFDGRGQLVLSRVIGGQTWTRAVSLDDYLTPMEASVVLSVHRVTVYDWMEKGLLQWYEGGHGDVLLWREVRDLGFRNGFLE